MSPPRLPFSARIALFGLAVFGLLPLRALHAIGAAIGRAIWLANGRLRRTAERNLSLVLTQKDAQKRHEIAHASLIETGRALTETAAIWGRDPARALALIRTVEGEALFDAARADGRGLIVAAPHLGCWELLNFWLARRGPLSIVYRPPRAAAIEPFLLAARGAVDVEQVRATGAGVRALYRRLAAGGIVGILPDQRPKQGEGVSAPFFGVPAQTMVLLSRLAARTGARVVFAFAERLPRGAGFRLRFVEAPAGIADDDLDIACAALNRGIERCVELAFEQYQWTYKRFA